ncbi:hemerythrin domain-containing protein [Streptomyces sp. NPDC054932]
MDDGRRPGGRDRTAQGRPQDGGEALQAVREGRRRRARHQAEDRRPGDRRTHHDTWIEEKIFYPAAREAAPDTKDHVLESIEEHHVVLWMLSELKDLDPTDERFDAKMTVLMENVRHHVEEEEKEWFPEVRKAMGRNRLTELGEQMEAAKKAAPGDPLAVPSADHY